MLKSIFAGSINFLCVCLGGRKLNKATLIIKKNRGLLYLNIDHNLILESTTVCSLKKNLPLLKAVNTVN